MSKTLEGLKEAFSGESEANMRYLAYAKQADKENQPQIARLFRAVAYAELIHAHNHLRVMNGIEATDANLKTAIELENYEVATMYPEFMGYAEEEGDKKALRTFTWAYEVEKGHEELLKQALETMGASVGDLEIWVCPACGHTHVGVRPEKCPVCGMPGERFEKVD